MFRALPVFAVAFALAGIQAPRAHVISPSGSQAVQLNGMSQSEMNERNQSQATANQDPTVLHNFASCTKQPTEYCYAKAPRKRLSGGRRRPQHPDEKDW